MSIRANDKATIVADIGENIEDPAEETFVLFSQDIPPNDLGILDNSASEIEIDINGREYTIAQSSGLLKSSRTAGTTGAVVWKVTPRVAEWLSLQSTVLWTKGLLDSSQTVLELGSGVAGLIGMALSPLVASYILTDQNYVLKLLKENITQNKRLLSKKQGPSKQKRGASGHGFEKLLVVPLDWEQDSVQNIKATLPANTVIDTVIVCDCVYNTFLIEPLTQTCVDICRMQVENSTTVIIAQQLRTDDVFEQWLTRFLKDFNVWRVRDDLLPLNLQSSSGYVVHLALLRDEG